MGTKILASLYMLKLGWLPFPNAQKTLDIKLFPSQFKNNNAAILSFFHSLMIQSILA